MRLLVRFAAAGSVSTLVMLSACSSTSSIAGEEGANETGPAASDAVVTADACDLVMREEAQAAVDRVVAGWEVADPEQRQGSCVFTATGNLDLGEAGNVQVRVTDDVPRESYDIYRDSFAGQDVPAVGEAAFWADTTMTLGVHVGGETYLEVQVLIPQGAAGHREAAIELARRALSRL